MRLSAFTVARSRTCENSYCSYNKLVIVWDENKRKSNLAKHGLDFADAFLVYENPEKLTLLSSRKDEDRRLDVAMIEVQGMVLALVYTERGQHVRVISFRIASRRERRRYAEAKAEQNGLGPRS